MGLSARVYTRRATIGPPNHGATSWPGRGSCGQQRRQVGHQLIARIKEQGPLAKGPQQQPPLLPAGGCPKP